MSDSIPLINFQPYRAITGMQATVFFLVRALFVAVADKIKIIPIDGKSRPTIRMVLAAGIGPLAQRGQGFHLVSHCIFSAASDYKKRTLSHNERKIQYGKNTGDGLRFEGHYSLWTELNVSISCINFS